MGKEANERAANQAAAERDDPVSRAVDEGMPARKAEQDDPRVAAGPLTGGPSERHRSRRALVRAALVGAVGAASIGERTRAHAQQVPALASCVDTINGAGVTLRKLRGASGACVTAFGFFERGDGGGGVFYWDSNSTEADDGGTTIQPVLMPVGRWKRIHDGAWSVRWFGATANRNWTAHDTPAIQAAIDAIAARGGGVVAIPPGTYSLRTTLIGASNVYLRGAGNGVSILRQQEAGVAALAWTDRSYFGLRDLTVVGNSSHGLHVVAKSDDVTHPLFENVDIIGFGGSSSGLLFEIAADHPIYFPYLSNVTINSGRAYPAIANEVGLDFGGSGSAICVGTVILGGRITNCAIGVRLDLCDTTRSFGLALDGIDTGLQFVRANGGYHRFEGIRFESEAVRVWIDFGPGSDSYVSGLIPNATGFRILDRGKRNEWHGSDGSGTGRSDGLFDRWPNPQDFRRLVIGGGTEIRSHLSATAYWDPPSIPDGATTGATVPVAGATVGDTVAVGFSRPVPAGALLAGAVTAESTVTVTLLNKTGTVLDLPSGTLRADVWKH